LCGVGAYVLARQLGLGAGAALVCGIIFAFSPARFFRFAQLHLTPLQWMPLTLAALHAYFEGSPRRGSDEFPGAKAGYLRLAIAFFTLQALSSLHGAVFLTIAVLIFLVQRALTGTPIAFAQRWRDVGVTGALLTLPALALIPPYLRAQRDMGLVRSLENWIPSRESFLASPTHAHTWVLSRLAETPINERASAFLFPGYLPIACAAVALLTIRASPHKRHVTLYSAITVAALLFAAGPPLSIWPYVHAWPVLNFIRVPSRFFLLAMVGIAVLAAIGFDRICEWVGPRRRAAVTAVTCALLVAEFATVPLPVVPFHVPPAGADRWLAMQPAPFAIAEVPVAPSERYHTTYMLHAMEHWQKTIHGYSGLLPDLHARVYRELIHFPDDTSLASLSALNVRFVVVHIDLYSRDEWAAVERRLEQYAARLSLEYGDAASRVYRLQGR
jgi:hypothetical protein